METQVCVTQHSFSLRDPHQEDGAFTNDDTWTDDGIGVGPGIIAIAGAARASGVVRIYCADKDSCHYDNEDGAEHYRIALWPAPASELLIRKRFAIQDDPIREYRGTRSKASLQQLLQSDHPSHRCLAMVALLRLGALETARRAAQSDRWLAVHQVFTSAAWFSGDAAEPVLARLLDHPVADIRIRALQSLSRTGCRDLKKLAGALELDLDQRVREVTKNVLEGWDRRQREDEIDG